MNFEEKDYKIFDIFNKQWALVTAGTMEHHNACTVSWGSLGTMWTRPGVNGSVATVYLYPTRHTTEVMKESETFTVSFFDPEHKKALGIMGSKSGRDTNKEELAGLTPKAITAEGTTGRIEGVTYEEANLTFVCRKIYQHEMSKEDIAQDVQEYYAANPQAYPVDENGDWHPHWVFVGDILKAEEKDA